MSTSSTLMVAPAQVVRGSGILSQAAPHIARLGERPLLIGGDRTLQAAKPFFAQMLQGLSAAQASYKTDCCETALISLQQAVKEHRADVIIGVGGGKALDTAKLVAYQTQLPVVTIPTSAATCAGWTALSNVYSERGAFRYDVGLPTCPELLLLDYDLVATAPKRTLVAGIGDAIAKWYEASVSSGHSAKTLIIGAVQQARVLRDILFQKSAAALDNPGGDDWREVVDASVLMAGVIGGMGGAQCRTVAAHAVHNGLTQIPASHSMLHGEKVAYGILVQLRLEEMESSNELAVAARQQLLRVYGQIGLPMTLGDLGLGEMSLLDLRQAAEFACQPNSDIHHLPFEVSPQQVMAAMVSTTAPCRREPSVAKLSKAQSPSHQS
ncbi:iron-containing alcohol dehydrogenase family protein [Leptothoe kymatousa]|uniref:Iron-containing alcohol dehydrogenase family protein n=1 Tax=Leptothoe kymatousa TAU-MAC 1615 TaxID=2364775 RepID=A0ABS5Y5L9_9CYAN|nr:iron-containing alcohol dehydrogenase family protein [Leptothoe kymatousa]MBT9313140.1 iron-containing alcohol dehydrogenase family protein [Leptothoe kymatousa TAU-MAC 1615]